MIFVVYNTIDKICAVKCIVFTTLYISMKCVLTGGPSCGKTSVIDFLRSMKYSVLDEAAREVLDSCREGSYEEKEIEIFERQLRREEEFEGGLVFLDRGVVDVLAYSNIYLGYLPERFRDFDFSGRYDGVFVLERLPFVDDGVRVEKGDEEAQRIHEEIIRVYKGEGYEPITVPLMSIGERAEFILKHVKNK